MKIGACDRCQRPAQDSHDRTPLLCAGCGGQDATDNVIFEHVAARRMTPRQGAEALMKAEDAVRPPRMWFFMMGLMTGGLMTMFLDAWMQRP